MKLEKLIKHLKDNEMHTLCPRKLSHSKVVRNTNLNLLLQLLQILLEFSVSLKIKTNSKLKLKLILPKDMTSQLQNDITFIKAKKKKH